MSLPGKPVNFLPRANTFDLLDFSDHIVLKAYCLYIFNTSMVNLITRL